MNKVFMSSLAICCMVLMQGCQSGKQIDEAYITVFDVLLEDHDLAHPIDYISLFINDEDLAKRDLATIVAHVEDTYGKKVFTYTPDEIVHEGPYGKEEVTMDGIFLYLLDIDQEEQTMHIETAKFHTVSDRGARGMDVSISQKDQEWFVKEANILWEE